MEHRIRRASASVPPTNFYPPAVIESPVEFYNPISDWYSRFGAGIFNQDNNQQTFANQINQMLGIGRSHTVPSALLGGEMHPLEEALNRLGGTIDEAREELRRSSEREARRADGARSERLGREIRTRHSARLARGAASEVAYRYAMMDDYDRFVEEWADQHPTGDRARDRERGSNVWIRQNARWFEKIAKANPQIAKHIPTIAKAISKGSKLPFIGTFAKNPYMAIGMAAMYAANKFIDTAKKTAVTVAHAQAQGVSVGFAKSASLMLGSIGGGQESVIKPMADYNAAIGALMTGMGDTKFLRSLAVHGIDITGTGPHGLVSNEELMSRVAARIKEYSDEGNIPMMLALARSQGWDDAMVKRAMQHGGNLPGVLGSSSWVSSASEHMWGAIGDAWGIYWNKMTNIFKASFGGLPILRESLMLTDIGQSAWEYFSPSGGNTEITNGDINVNVNIENVEDGKEFGERLREGLGSDAIRTAFEVRNNGRKL